MKRKQINVSLPPEIYLRVQESKKDWLYGTDAETVREIVKRFYLDPGRRA